MHRQNYSLWSVKLATLHSMSFFSRANFKTEKKTTQALSVHGKGTFDIYNECLIVICLHVTTIKRWGGKCQSLEYLFELMMEFGDASNEEASCHDLNKMDLSNDQCLEAISMLLMNAMEDHLKRGSVMAIAKRFDVACLMIHRLWK